MWPCCVLVVDKKGKLSVSQSGLACNRLTDGQSEPLAVGERHRLTDVSCLLERRLVPGVWECWDGGEDGGVGGVGVGVGVVYGDTVSCVLE